MLFSDRSFISFHKFLNFHSPNELRMKQIMKTFPEILGVLPLRVVDGDKAWDNLICSLNMKRDIVK